MLSRRPSSRWRPQLGHRAPGVSTTAAASARAGGPKLIPRRKAILAILDEADRPLDFGDVRAAMADRGVTLSTSSLYRLLSEKIAADLVMCLRRYGERRFLAPDKAATYRLEDADGRPVEADVPGLQAPLTLASLDAGLPLGGQVLVRFEQRVGVARDPAPRRPLRRR